MFSIPDLAKVLSQIDYFTLITEINYVGKTI